MARVCRAVVVAAIAAAAAVSCSADEEEQAAPPASTSTTASTTGSERVIYLATQEVFSDALVAGPAAANGALFLVPPDELPPSVAEDLRARRPCRVVAAGGPSAIAPHVIREANDACREPPTSSTTATS